MNKHSFCLMYDLKLFEEKGLLRDLAYETGVHIGDGSMGRYFDKFQNGFKTCIQYTGDAKNEFEFHNLILRPLLYKLYGIDKIVKLKRDNSCIIVTRSKSLFLFKKSLGLPVGKKIDVKLPSFLKGDLKLDFIRGLADTDFSLLF